MVDGGWDEPLLGVILESSAGNAYALLGFSADHNSVCCQEHILRNMPGGVSMFAEMDDDPGYNELVPRT